MRDLVELVGEVKEEDIVGGGTQGNIFHSYVGIHQNPLSLRPDNDPTILVHLRGLAKIYEFLCLVRPKLLSYSLNMRNILQ